MSLPWSAWIGSTALAPRVFFVLLGAAARGGVLLLLAAAVVRVWPRASAAQRHLVWAVACCSLPLVPVLPLVVPAWRVVVHIPALPATVAPVINSVSGTDQPAKSRTVEATAHAASRGHAMTIVRPLPVPVWLLVCLWVWGSGTLVALAVLLSNQQQVRRLVSDALPLTDARMLAVLARARSTVQVTRRVPVKLHPSTVPMVCGVLWPAIVLPVSARTWGEDRLYNILLHELAHVKRYDCLTQTVAFLACAFYWCNPLVWLAVRRLQTEQEQACDDMVLASGSHPRSYATDLLDLTQAIQPNSTLSLATLPFARPSELQKRMQSIIDRSRHRSLVSRRRVLAVWGAGLGFMYPLVALTPRMRTTTVNPRTFLRENKQANKLKQTAMAASTAAGLPAPVSRQAPAVRRVGSDAMIASEADYYRKIDFSKVIGNIRYRQAYILFMPMVDTIFHFVVVDGDRGEIVYNSEKDGVKCWPEKDTTDFINSTDRWYYEEPSHTRLTKGWNPKHVNFSLVFHHRENKDQAMQPIDCPWMKKGDWGFNMDRAFDSTKVWNDEQIRQNWLPQDTVR